MDLYTDDGSLTLARDGLLALRDAAGTRLVARSGSFWVTQEGCARDDVLNPGDCLVLRAPGLTVVTAVRAGELDVRSPGRQAAHAAQPRRKTLAQRALGWLARLQRLWASGRVHAL
jgi:hypothetical protein